MAYELPDNLTSLANDEYVNGLWNSILGHYYFQYPNYIIKPESRVASVGRVNVGFADLVVCDRNGRNKLLFEGKRHTLWPWGISKADAIQQATSYARISNVKFVIVASNNEVTFLQVDDQGTSVALVLPGTTFADWIEVRDIGMVHERMKYMKMVIEEAPFER